jgi:uncharacterized protein YcnI
MSSTPSARPRRRTARRVGLVLGAGFLASVGLTGVADAHVEVQPASVPGGDFAVIAFRVPNESDSARTTSVRVVLPKNHPIGSVQTTAMPGWTVSTRTRTLAQPIQVEGEQLDHVVSQVTWRATGGGIQPGQYDDFDLSLGTLPDSGKLVFNAFQTYSDGKVVAWNEVSADASVEAEHPAPTLVLTAPAEATDGAASAAAPESPAADAASTPAAPTEQASTSDDGSASATWALVLSAGALLVSALTAFMVWRRGRPAPVEPPARRLEDSTR